VVVRVVVVPVGDGGVVMVQDCSGDHERVAV
jgi:hypothetical protein